MRDRDGAHRAGDSAGAATDAVAGDSRRRTESRRSASHRHPRRHRLAPGRRPLPVAGGRRSAGRSHRRRAANLRPASPAAAADESRRNSISPPRHGPIDVWRRWSPVRRTASRSLGHRARGVRDVSLEAVRAQRQTIAEDLRRTGAGPARRRDSARRPRRAAQRRTAALLSDRHDPRARRVGAQRGDSGDGSVRDGVDRLAAAAGGARS